MMLPLLSLEGVRVELQRLCVLADSPNDLVADSPVHLDSDLQRDGLDPI